MFVNGRTHHFLQYSEVVLWRQLDEFDACSAQETNDSDVLAPCLELLRSFLATPAELLRNLDPNEIEICSNRNGPFRVGDY